MASPALSWGFGVQSACFEVLVDEAADGVTALDPSCWQGDDGGVVGRGALVSALEGAGVIEIARVVAKDLLSVAAAEQQDAVGALLAYGANEALRVRVAVRASGRNLCHSDAVAGEHGVERRGELGVTIPDQVVELAGAVADLPQELACLLGGPGRGWVGGDAEDVDSAGAHFHDEQGIGAVQA